MKEKNIMGGDINEDIISLRLSIWKLAYKIKFGINNSVMKIIEEIEEKIKKSKEEWNIKDTERFFKDTIKGYKEQIKDFLKNKEEKKQNIANQNPKDLIEVFKTTQRYFSLAEIWIIIKSFSNREEFISFINENKNRLRNIPKRKIDWDYEKLLEYFELQHKKLIEPDWTKNKINDSLVLLIKNIILNMKNKLNYEKRN